MFSSRDIEWGQILINDSSNKVFYFLMIINEILKRDNPVNEIDEERQKSSNYDYSIESIWIIESIRRKRDSFSTRSVRCTTSSSFNERKTHQLYLSNEIVSCWNTNKYLKKKIDKSGIENNHHWIDTVQRRKQDRIIIGKIGVNITYFRLFNCSFKEKSD